MNKTLTAWQQLYLWLLGRLLLLCRLILSLVTGPHFGRGAEAGLDKLLQPVHRHLGQGLTSCLIYYINK